jgi:hypothetical protein
MVAGVPLPVNEGAQTVRIGVSCYREIHMATKLQADIPRARELAARIFKAFAPRGPGIFGRATMPEDEPPPGVERGSLEHVIFITLTVSIDYQRDAHELWAVSRAAYANPDARYLFVPQEVHEAGFAKFKADLKDCGLARKPQNDARTWYTVAVTFLKKWEGDPRRFLDDCGWDGPIVLRRLGEDTHPERSRQVPDYPFLRGPKIGPLWLRMLRDNVGLDLIGLDKVPIPVDVHVARATFTTGVLTGSYDGPVKDAFEEVRTAWRDAAVGLLVGERPMIALDVDEALWHLSKFGCSPGRANDGKCSMRHACPAAAECVMGLVEINGTRIRLAT